MQSSNIGVLALSFVTHYITNPAKVKKNFARQKNYRQTAEQYIFDKDSGAQAVYEISGTTLNNYLQLVSYG